MTTCQFICDIPRTLKSLYDIDIEFSEMRHEHKPHKKNYTHNIFTDNYFGTYITQLNRI